MDNKPESKDQVKIETTTISTGLGKNGNLNRGGTPGNKGGGRKKDEFLVWCKKACDDPRARKFVVALINGDAIEEKTVTKIGSRNITSVFVTAPATARIRALEFCAGYAHGKPIQALSNPDGSNIGSMVGVEIKLSPEDAARYDAEIKNIMEKPKI